MYFLDSIVLSEMASNISKVFNNSTLLQYDTEVILCTTQL